MAPAAWHGVAQESRARQAASLNEVEVLGERVPIRSDKVRIAILAQKRIIGELEGVAPSDATIMAKYDELFVAFNDALDGASAPPPHGAQIVCACRLDLSELASVTWSLRHMEQAPRSSCEWQACGRTCASRKRRGRPGAG